MSAYRLETSQYNGAPRTNLHYVVVFFIILCHKMSRINYSFPRFLSRSPHQTDDDALFYSVCSAQRYMLCTRYVYSSLSFYCQRGDTKSTRQTRRKKNYEIFYDSLTCKFSPGDNRLVLGDHTPRCQHQAFLLLTGGSGVITLCIL